MVSTLNSFFSALPVLVQVTLANVMNDSPSYPETYNDIVIDGDPNQYKFLSTETSSSAKGKCIMALVKLS